MRPWIAIVGLGCAGPEPAGGRPDPDPPDSSSSACVPVGVEALTVSPLPGDALGLTVQAVPAEPVRVDVSCTLTEAPPVWRQLVPFGSSWRYLVGAPPIGWTEPGFDDGAWSEGPAPLAAIQTAATPLPAGDATVWFRATFDVTDPGAVVALAGQVRRDDGVAVYLGGQEVFRDNLPEGALLADTPASSDLRGVTEAVPVRFPIDPAMLVEGTNQLAVEVHPFAPGGAGGDLAFDLRLSAQIAEPPPDPPEVHRVSFEAPAEAATILGVLAEATYECTAVGACGGASASASVTTPPLSIAPPELASRAAGVPAWGAYTLFNHQRPCAEDWHNRFYVVDPDGRVRWVHDPGLDARSSIDLEVAWLGDGTFLYGGADHEAGRPRIVALDQTLVHEAGYPGVEEDIYHHDVVRVGREISGLVQRPAAGGPVEADGIGIVTYDQDAQEVVWQWDAQTAIDAGTLFPPTDVDPYHANAFTYVEDADGPAFYVTLLFANRIVRVDRATGELTWTLGRGGDFALVDADGDPLPDEAWFDGVHSIEVHDDRMIVYENGHSALHSHALELTLDTEARVATRSWSWTEIDWFEPLWGDVDELPTGDLLVAMAHNWCGGGNPAHLGALLDVRRATGEVAWRLDFLDPEDAMYRAERLEGCALFANSRYCP